MSLDPSTQRALEGALFKLGVSAGQIKENPTKAGMCFVFGRLSPAKPDPLSTPSKDENAA